MRNGSRWLLGHPVVLAAIALLALNDHFLKHVRPSWLTGKLSDIAGLVFFPALVFALYDVVRRLRRRRESGLHALAACAITTAVVFASIKVSPSATDLYRVGLALLQWPFRAAAALASGRMIPAVHRVAAVTDPTDLLALPFAFVTLALARSTRGMWTRSSAPFSSPVE